MNFFLSLRYLKIYFQKNIQKKFGFWPFNMINHRRGSTFTPSFTYKNNLQRRILINDDDTILIDYNFLSHNRRFLFRDRSRNWDSSILSFWINPSADFANQYSYREKEDDIEKISIYFLHKKLFAYLIEEDDDDINDARFGEDTDIFGKRYSLNWNLGLDITHLISNILVWEYKDIFDLDLKDFWNLKMTLEDDDLVMDLNQLKFPNKIITETLHNGKDIPNSLEIFLRNEYGTYIPGDIESMKHSSFVWPGTNSFLLIPKTYFRPLSERDFRPESELDLPKKGHYIGR